MMSWLAAIRVENTKLYRSYVFIGILAFFLFVTVIRAGESDWTVYLQNVVFMFSSVFGIIGFGAVVSWTFGREYTDRTFKDLLALPVSRGTIVMAKSAVAASCCFILALITFGFAIMTGFIAGMQGFSTVEVKHYLIQLLIAVCLHVVLCGPVAFIASASRGYLMPIGFAFTTLMVALIAGSTPLGAYLPWSIPALQLAGSSISAFPLNAVSYMIPVIAGTAGLAATWAWWRSADHK